MSDGARGDDAGWGEGRGRSVRGGSVGVPSDDEGRKPVAATTTTSIAF